MYREGATIDSQEADVISAYVSASNIMSVLEFGPGKSTMVFLSAGACIDTYESDQKWYQFYVPIFAEHPRCTLNMFNNVYPLNIQLRRAFYDLAFIDAPSGRWRDENFPQYARINTVMFATMFTNKILIHDTNRQPEQNTISLLKNNGWVATSLPSIRGLTLLERIITHCR